MKALHVALACASLTMSAAVTAQVAPLAPMAAGAAVLRTGTPVALTMREMLTTKGKKLRVGQRFQLEVAEAVAVNGQTVIPAGSSALGEITEVRNKGMWGKSGGINARVLHVRVGDRTIRLTGQIDDKGKTGTAGVVAAVAFIPIAGFFTTGTSAVIPLGAPVSAFVDEDVELAFMATPTVPMAVGVPAPAQTSQPAVIQTSTSR